MSVVAIAHLAWLGFVASWWAAAFWVGKATTKSALAGRIVYLAGFVIGFGALLSFGIARLPRWNAPLWQAPVWMNLLLFVAECGGFAFAWWARLHLGRLWSNMMTLREGHRVVDTGPYALVRHPIYTAFIGSSWAYALIVARPIALFGAVVLTILMTVKGKDEERFLRRELGAAGYDTYAAHTPMLVPRPGRRSR